jgi:hypothetical protein
LSLLRPSDPTAPQDPLGSKADIHLTGITGVATLAILLVLHATVFRHGGAPADLVLVLSPTISYVTSVLAGVWHRRRLLRGRQGPISTGVNQPATPPPPEPLAGRQGP